MLLIRNEQMDAFRTESATRFQNQMVAHLIATYPTRYSSMPEREVRAFIRKGIEMGRRYEVKTEDAVSALLEMMTTFGEGLERSPDPLWIREILEHPRLPGSLKVELIQDRFGDLLRGEMVVASQPDEL